MKGGFVKVVGIESKTFELRVVGTYEDILKISEQGEEGVSQFFCLSQLLCGY